MSHKIFRTSTRDLGIGTQEPCVCPSGKARGTTECDSCNYGVNRPNMQFSPRHVWVTRKLPRPCLPTQHKVWQPVRTISTLSPSRWKMEHGGEIGFGVRFFPLSSAYGLAPDCFMADVVMREAV